MGLVLTALLAILGGQPGAEPDARDPDPAAVPISLARARDVAFQAGPEVVLAEQRAALARADIDVAGALANPTLGASTARLTAKVAANLSQPLPLFGQRGLAVSAARADAATARLEVDVFRLEARWNATLAWLDLWEAQERARLLGLAADDADRLARAAEARFNAGTAGRVDAVRAGADRARARAEANAAQTDVTAAAARLAILLRVVDGPTLQAAGDPSLPAPPAEAEARNRLLAAHPQLARDRSAIAAAGARVRLEQRQRWPIVTPDIAVAIGDPTLPGTDVIGGLSLELPVLNLRAGPIARARAEQTLAEETADLDQRRLLAALSEAYRRTDGAQLKARALEDDVLPAIEEARRMTEQGYRDGRVDLVRVLDAQRAVLETRLAAIAARASWQRAVADVERTAGQAGATP